MVNATRVCEHGPCEERVVDGGGGRIPKYCSTRCRVAAHRARKAIPAELRERRRWVRRDEHKVPLMARSGRKASPTAPGTWATHEAAAHSEHGVGLGYVLRQGDGIVCVDLDHCVRPDGTLKAWAQRIVDQAPPTFIETSPSGTGLHIWGRGEFARGRRIRRGDMAVEVYGTGRYIALGERWQSAPLHLADLDALIADLTR